jgi:DinB family protein
MPLSESILTRLQHQHETIGELIEGLDEQALRRNVNPGKWSALDNIAHLACYQLVFLRRLERIQAKDSPVFDRYVADSDPDFPAYRQSLPDELLAGLREQRSLICSKLQRMDETALRRTGLHPRYGLLDMRQWAEFFLLHEAHHLYTLFFLVQELRKLSR